MEKTNLICEELARSRLKKPRSYLSSVMARAIAPIIFMGLFAAPAHAQISFDRPGGATSGGIDVDGDGVYDEGTWEFTNRGRALNSFNITSEGGFAARYRQNSGTYTVLADFTATLTDPEVTFQLGVFGNETLGQTYESKASQYIISWTGITGSGTVLDPSPYDQIDDNTIIDTPSSITVFQNLPPAAAPRSCVWNTAGHWRNFCLEWGVLAPNGATDLTINASGGTVREGYRFAAISYADLQVNKTVSDNVLAVGDSGHFTITIENIETPGNSVALNTLLSDLLPAGLSFTSAAISATGANTGGSYDALTGEWDIGRLSQGEQAELQINFTVDNHTGGTTLTNEIDPSSLTSSQLDPIDNHISLTASVEISLPEISAEAETLSAIQGSLGGNSGSILASDRLDGVTPLISDLVITTVSISDSSGAASTAISLDEDMGVITVPAGTAPGTYMVRYKICEAVNNLNCAEATETIVVTQDVSDLVTVKSLTSENNPPVEGDLITYDITVTNQGGSDATNVTLTDLIPDGLTATGNNGTVSGTLGSTGGSYNDSNGLWTIGALAVDASAALKIEGIVKEGQNNMTIVNTTTRAVSDQLDPTEAGDVTSVSVFVNASADLSIIKSNTPNVNAGVDQANDTVTSGDTTEYTLVVTNNGPHSVTGPIVTDTPSSGLNCTGSDIVSISGTGSPVGTYTIADLTGVGIPLGTLGGGDMATLSYSCIVN